jgi:hypothetical protein
MSSVCGVDGREGGMLETMTAASQSAEDVVLWILVPWSGWPRPSVWPSSCSGSPKVRVVAAARDRSHPDAGGRDRVVPRVSLEGPRGNDIVRYAEADDASAPAGKRSAPRGALPVHVEIDDDGRRAARLAVKNVRSRDARPLSDRVLKLGKPVGTVRESALRPDSRDVGGGGPAGVPEPAVEVGGPLLAAEVRPGRSHGLRRARLPVGRGVGDGQEFLPGADASEAGREGFGLAQGPRGRAAGDRADRAQRQDVVLLGPEGGSNRELTAAAVRDHVEFRKAELRQAIGGGAFLRRREKRSTSPPGEGGVPGIQVATSPLSPRQGDLECPQGSVP